MREVSGPSFRFVGANRNGTLLLHLPEDRDSRLCQFDDGQDQCRFFYTYHTENDQLVLRVQKTKSNPFIFASSRNTRRERH